MEAAWLLPCSGLLCGMLLGATARYYHFCTLSALERHWFANDSNGLRSWVLAATVAMAATQFMVFTDLISTTESFYLNPRFSLVGAVLGGVLFGFGMALVGTCGFGALVRLGGGSLQSLIVVAVIGLVALSTQRGVLALARENLIEPLAIDFGHLGSQSIPELIAAVTVPSLYWPSVLLCLALLLFWIFKDRQFRSSHASIISGSLIGLCVASGWLITSRFSDYLYSPVQLESASFVLPPGQFIQALVNRASPLPDYGIGLTLGVVLGAQVVAIARKDIRWEACDDARELRRHLGGAFLMGLGGVLAAGCTMGQGVSAFSVLALSAPIVFLSICLGARLGLSWLLEGLPFRI